MDSVSGVYEFVRLLTKKSRERGLVGLATELENCMSLGSSGLEILGAIRKVLCDRRLEIMNTFDAKDLAMVADVISFVDKAYGR